MIEGIKRKGKREMEADLWRAYTAASLNAAAGAGKLKSLAHYRNRLMPQKVAQTPLEMLEVFKQFQANGAPMTIRRIERTPA